MVQSTILDHEITLNSEINCKGVSCGSKEGLDDGLNQMGDC